MSPTWETLRVATFMERERILEIVRSRIDPECRCPECVECQTIVKLILGERVAGDDDFNNVPEVDAL